MQFYPRARQHTLPSIHDPAVRSRRLLVLRSAAQNLVLLQLLFLGLFCYLLASLFQESGHIHKLNILLVDYDGGPVGAAVRAGYERLRGTAFPTLIEQPTASYPEPQSIEHAVCNIDYWAAVYVGRNASNRVAAAFTGGSAASEYNGSDILTLVWNEARYSTVVDSTIEANIQTLSQTARVLYTEHTGIAGLNATDPAAMAAFANPWTLSQTNLQPTTQGSRLIYNTLVIILIMIQEFFYLGYINGLYHQFSLYVTLAPHRIAIARQLISSTYTLIGSLTTAGAIWAFRATWAVNGVQFVLTWMSLWLFAHLNFLVLDIFTVWIAAPFVPMALITWLMLNICSILLPFELSPGFYQWGYAMPAHAVFQVLIDIWSGGCNPQLAYALPVLFGYELVGLTVSTIGVYRRAHCAVLAKEVEEKSWRERVAAAIAEQRLCEMAEKERAAELAGEGADCGEASVRHCSSVETADEAEEAAQESQLEDRIMREWERPRPGRQDTGPSFRLTYE